MISPVEFSELICLRCGDAAECLSRNILYCGDLIIHDKNLLVIREGRHSVSVLLAFDNYIRQDCRVDKRSDTVMDDDDVVRTAFALKIIHAVPDGLLAGLSSGHDPLQLVDVELFSVSPDNIVPSVDTYDLDRVDLRVFLKTFQCVDQDRFIIYIYELLRDILSHPGS